MTSRHFDPRFLFLFLMAFFVFSFSGCGKKGDEQGGASQSKSQETRNTIKNPDTFILATYGTVATLDPAASYDSSGRQRLINIYETLIDFKGSSTDEYIPVLAARVPSLENGGISPDGLTYTFEIRKGVKFHNGNDLTPEDVLYSFKRHMIMDPSGGPMWMLLEALTGEGSTRDNDNKIKPGIFKKIDESVELKDSKLIFHLPKPFPPFLGIVAYISSAIIDREWAIENGCWDGKIENAVKFNNPPPGHEPLQEITNGTGAYVMKSWEASKEFVFERFDGYWGEKPSIKTAIVKYVKEWSTRKLMFQNEDADKVTVDLQYLPEIQKMKHTKMITYPLLKITAAFFCQRINPIGNPNIGSGKLDGNGINPEFFSDINMRKAFLHAMDSETYKKDTFNGYAIVPSSPNIKGLPYHKDVPTYEFDLEKSKEYLKKAWGGRVWEKGFKMIITYNTGNEMRQTAALMLAENIMSLNSRFRIEVRSVDWKDYTVKYRNYEYPIFLTGWGADYADPHNFMYTMMHSNGVYGRFMAFKSNEVDRLCQEGILEVDPEKRDKIYTRLQNLWYENAIGIPLAQAFATPIFRDYVKGVVPHPMNDEDTFLFKTIRKSYN